MSEGADARFLNVRRAFTGGAPALPLAVARIALGLLVLVRTTDLGRGLVAFNHHTWMSGVEYAPNVDSTTAPALVSPLLPGFALGTTATWVLVTLRTLAALLLVLGVRVRTSAALVALTGLLLMAADRYRYLHHLYLLFTMTAWFALVPSGERLSLERWLRKRAAAEIVPRWSLQLVRAYCAAVYLASGVAKLRPAWLSGQTLRDLDQVSLIGGPVWQAATHGLGHAPIAWAVCLTELCLAPLLLFPSTRRYGVALGVALHAGVMATMEVSTFSGQMLLLLALFLVADRPLEPHGVTLAKSPEASSKHAAAPKRPRQMQVF